MKIKQGKRKGKISVVQVMEILIRLGFFVMYPALFSTAFTGIKAIVTRIAAHEPLPWNSFVETLLVLLFMTICFGRFFCGYACAFGSYGDFVYFLSSFIRKKLKKKPLHLFQRISGAFIYLKYVVLFVILILCILGQGDKINMHSPFSAFARIHALHMPGSRIGLALLVLITAGMAVEPRFFCRFLCPMGAIFSLLPVLPFSLVTREETTCIPGCKACKMACPANLDLPCSEEGDNRFSGECFSCGKCIHRCPRQNAGTVLAKDKGWLVLQIIKALILAAALWYIYR